MPWDATEHSLLVRHSTPAFPEYEPWKGPLELEEKPREMSRDQISGSVQCLSEHLSRDKDHTRDHSLLHIKCDRGRIQDNSLYDACNHFWLMGNLL
jgi:hypothetical protein